MRIVIDLQACQSPTSRYRGIGRYSMLLAQAITRRSAGKHDVWLALNGRLSETIADIRNRFRDLMPPERIVTFQLPPQPVLYTGGWQNRASEAIRERFLTNLAPDIVHVSSLFEGRNTEAVTTIGKVPNAVTLYDLIPLLHKETYLSDEDARSWYFSKIGHLRKAQLWLAISGYSRDEAIAALDLPRDRVVNISAGVDDCFRPLAISEAEEQELRDRYGLTRPFLMHTGGFESRKNVKGLIEAFAMLPSRRDYQLAIVCSPNDEEREVIMAHAAKAGLCPGELVITGFVPEKDLVTLYNLCHLFVFPSLHEGFGLPVLEAMASGAPVISSNISGIPEVIGRSDALFDASRPAAIAKAVARVLADEGFRQELRSHGQRQARLFSWDESARRALEAFGQFEKSIPKASTMEQSEVTTGLVAELVAAREAVEAEVNTLRDQVGWLKMQIDTMQEQVAWFKIQIETTQQQVIAAGQREQELAVTNARLERGLSATQAINSDLVQSLQQWQNIAESRRLELQCVFASSSWQLTKPLRRIGQWFRKRKERPVGTER